MDQIPNPAVVPSLSPPTLGQRLGALTYESVLLFGVLFFASAVTHTVAPGADDHPWALRAVLFVALGAYFGYCWHRSGQTLAMKAWQLRVVDRQGGPVRLLTALLRYVAAWTLVLPGIVLVWLTSARGLGAFLVYLAGLLLMFLPIVFDRGERRLLHDRLVGTRLVRVAPSRAKEPG